MPPIFLALALAGGCAHARSACERRSGRDVAAAANGTFPTFWFNHIPKTGGHNVAMWIRHNPSDFELDIADGPCDVAFREGLDRLKSTTRAHCSHRLNPLATPKNHSFCTVREPLARLISAFNMVGWENAEKRFKGLQHCAKCRCDVHTLDRWLRELPFNHRDNHKVAMSAYYCDVYLCIDCIQEEFTALVRARDAIVRATELPAKAWGKTSHCEIRDIPAETRALLLERYADDVRLDHAVCRLARNESWRLGEPPSSERKPSSERDRKQHHKKAKLAPKAKPALPAL